MSRIGMYLSVAICCLLLCSITPCEAAVSCQDATAATVNGTLLLGTWFEAARKPIGGGTNTEECVQLVVSYDNMTVSSTITYSTAPNLWINQTTTNVLQVNQTVGSETPQLFTAVFYLVANGVNTTLKILETDYSSYLLSCAYTTEENSVSTTSEATASSTLSAESTTISSSSNASTSVTSNSTIASVSTTTEAVSSTPAGAFILTRQRQVNASILTSLMQNATSNFMDFANLSNVTQSSECYNSGAGTTIPVLAVVMTMFYTLLNLVH